VSESFVMLMDPSKDAMTQGDSDAAPVLRVEGLTHRFGGVAAVDGCDWQLPGGVIAALIGPNGAGKTTLANVIAGYLRLQVGRIQFVERDISKWPPHRIANQGIVRTFQISRGFERLTVTENLLVAAPDQPGESVLNAFLRPGLTRRAEKRNLERAADLLNLFELFHLRNEYASDLSGGQKRLLEIARALMAEPKLLLLDEPMAGINPVLIDRICEHLVELQKSGLTMLLIEHNLGVVEGICSSVTVMVEGRVLATGTMATLREHPEVIEAYLGREVTDVAAS
jgi:ABC-type branched-subunit amino acid transport system ATPase component